MEKFYKTAEQYTPLIHRVIRTLNIYKDKEDYFQIGLIALWEAEQKYCTNEGEFLPFAYSTIRGRMLTQLYKEKRWETSNSLLETQDGILDNTKLQYKDTYFALEDLMHYGQHLTSNQRKWLMGVCYKGMTLRDISLEHSVSLTAVKSWRKSAVKKLKRMKALKES